MPYVALDLSKENITGCVMDSRGRLIKQEKFPNNVEALDKFFEGINKSKIVIEAGYNWEPTYDYLSSKHKVILAHPKEVKAIAKSKIKTDKIDSTTLAKLLRADLIPEAYAPSKAIRELRNKCRHRSYIVGLKTRIINKIRAEAVRRCIQLPTKKFGIKARKYLTSLNIDTINRYLRLLDVFEYQITEVDTELAQYTSIQEIKTLTTIPGINYYLALMIYSEIADITRFPDSEKLCCYAGLIPSTYQSGNKTIKGQLTREGDRWLRWAMIQASWCHIRSKDDTWLKRHYRKVFKRTRNDKKAVAATARKMLKAIWWMLKFGERFVS